LAGIRARLKAALPGNGFLGNQGRERKERSAQALARHLLGVSTMAAIIGCLVLLNTLLMSVTERTREIGVLSAVGWSPRRILGMIVLEGLLLSAAGGLLGIGLGFRRSCAA